MTISFLLLGCTVTGEAFQTTLDADEQTVIFLEGRQGEAERRFGRRCWSVIGVSAKYQRVGFEVFLRET